MLKINRIVKNVCFHVIPCIHFPVPEDTEEDIKYAKIEKKNPAQKRKNNIFEYLNNDAKKNKWRSLLGNTVSPYDDTGRSSAIDSATSNYNNAKEKVQKIYVCSSKQVNMTKIFPDTFLACLSLIKLHLEIEMKKLFEYRKVLALGATPDAWCKNYIYQSTIHSLWANFTRKEI